MKNRKDWILIGSFLGIACVTAVWLQFFTARGTQVVAKVDGQEVGRWSLETSVDKIIETETGQNHLVIAGGKASIVEADCPDGICVKQGKISHTGQTIVCLPHKLVIEITGKAQENGLDAVAK